MHGHSQRITVLLPRLVVSVCLGQKRFKNHNGQEIQPGLPYLEYVGYPNSGGVAKTKATGTLRWELPQLGGGMDHGLF